MSEHDPEPLALLVPIDGGPDDLATLVTKVEQHVSPPFSMLIVLASTGEATGNAVQRLAASRPWIRVLETGDAGGVAGALRSGFRSCVVEHSAPR